MILVPSNYGCKSNSSLSKWREFLREELVTKRKFRSDYSGLEVYQTGFHMHEGIISRAVVPAGIKWHYMIHCEYNCFILLPEEHIPQPPSREWCILKAYEYYGKDAVQEWYYNLPFKSLPFRLPEA